jgi:hypothetical protein
MRKVLILFYLFLFHKFYSQLEGVIIETKKFLKTARLANVLLYFLPISCTPSYIPEGEDILRNTLCPGHCKQFVPRKVYPSWALDGSSIINYKNCGNEGFLFVRFKCVEWIFFALTSICVPAVIPTVSLSHEK